MRLLVISDVHANFEALRRVPEDGYDRVLCLGDLVDYGPSPGPCLRWLRDRGAVVVRGNHDHAVARGIPVRCGAATLAAAEETRQRMRLLLEHEEMDYLSALPPTTRLDLGGVRFQLVHAVPTDPLHRYCSSAIPTSRWSSAPVAGWWSIRGASVNPGTVTPGLPTPSSRTASPSSAVWPTTSRGPSANWRR